MIDFGACTKCGQPRYCKRVSQCRACRSATVREYQERLKAQGINPNLPRGVVSHVPAKGEPFRCNTCSALCDGPRALIKHKRTHSVFQPPEEMYSITPSCASWTGG